MPARYALCHVMPLTPCMLRHDARGAARYAADDGAALCRHMLRARCALRHAVFISRAIHAATLLCFFFSPYLLSPCRCWCCRIRHYADAYYPHAYGVTPADDVDYADFIFCSIFFDAAAARRWFRLFLLRWLYYAMMRGARVTRVILFVYYRCWLCLCCARCARCACWWRVYLQIVCHMRAIFHIMRDSACLFRCLRAHARLRLLILFQLTPFSSPPAGYFPTRCHAVSSCWWYYAIDSWYFLSSSFSFPSRIRHAAMRDIYVYAMPSIAIFLRQSYAMIIFRLLFAVRYASFFLSFAFSLLMSLFIYHLREALSCRRYADVLLPPMHLHLQERERSEVHLRPPPTAWESIWLELKSCLRLLLL